MALDNLNNEEAGVKIVPIDGRVDISCDPDGAMANMILFSPQNGGRPVTAEMIMNELANKGIVHGIDEMDIKEMVTSRVYDTPICVARADLPKRGQSGTVNFHFDKDRKPKPYRDEFGITNYRELNVIVPIRRGEVIADIIPPSEGTPGTNIFGKPIPAEPGAPAKVTVGKNTAMTVDGKTSVASCDGHVVYGTGCFSVEDTVTIKSDLDMSVGNLSFFGDIHIKGNVMEGFIIAAGKNVRVDGTVFGAEIVAGGNVTIVGGAINTKIECGGNADIGFCDNTEIKANGNVVSKQFAFCNIFCYGGLTAKGAHGVIVGGKISSMRDVTAGVIGSEKYTATEINIGDGSVIFARKRQAEEELETSSKAYDLAIKNLDYLKYRRTQQGGALTDSQQKQFKTETRNKLFHAMRKKELGDLIAQLDEDIKNKDALCAKCSGIIYPGAKFCINFFTMEITETAVRSTVTVLNDAIAVIPN